MRVRFGIRMFPIVLLAASIALPSFAATPAMEACSAKWADLKAANKTKGQTWPEFWSQCSKDFAAKNGTEPAQPEKTTSKKAAAKTAAVDEIPRARVNKRKPATRSGIPTSRDPGLMAGTTISSLWPSVCRSIFWRASATLSVVDVSRHVVGTFN